MSARRQYSDKHTLPENPTYRTIDYSDGKEDHWPRNTTEVVDEDGHVNFMQPIELDNSIAIRWRASIGASVANSMKWPVGPSYVLQDWPAGYRMYDHHKGLQGAPRHDIYLFGGPSRFRSIAEFVPHAIWLANNMTTNCGCKYCTKKPQREITTDISKAGIFSPLLRTGIAGLHRSRQLEKQSALRHVGFHASVQKTSKLKQSRRITKIPLVVERDQDLRAVCCHAAHKMRLKRWYREGEVVWVALDGPISLSGDKGEITFWPVIIEEVKIQKTINRLKDRANLVPLPPVEMGEPSEQSESVLQPVRVPPWEVTETYAYKVKFLAVSRIYTVVDSQVLPYRAYLPPSNVITFMHSLQPEAFNFDKEFLQTCNPQSSPPPSWRSVVSAYAFALQIGDSLAAFWNMTDEWQFKFTPQAPVKQQQPQFSLTDAIMAASSQNTALHQAESSSIPTAAPPSSSFYSSFDPSGFRDGLSSQEKQAVAEDILGPSPVIGQTIEQLNFQGMWWGAERIWVNEIVLLKPLRAVLAPEGTEHILPPAGPGKAQTELCHRLGRSPKEYGAGARGLFMRLERLFLVEGFSGSQKTKECRASGVLYELADKDWEDPDKVIENPSASESISSGPMPPASTQKPLSNLQPSPVSPYLLPEAPEGYYFRPILKDGYEMTISLTMISGRYYPKILTHHLLKDIVHEAIGCDAKTSLERNKHLWSLEGLNAGYVNSVDPTKYKIDRTQMIRDADRVSRELITNFLEPKKRPEVDELMDVV
ncbi:uncharacterized protein BT62DRAFT_970236 [Guyanagaster necrorhizus]|uniref:Cryptic loci regulator 2 N-terminal domain-containing protein n=1 Tax=Guyanagaster necrorhizus TaxID=856835 RepID=A0A9P7VS83_9AGAR|nr:uncharacterized protein BT62DRAFT_970236 [Guyanagaster necrorhizus MCA 3950]KAG7445019.1 hypothetical protein BT62DRAFT_970236 [Guyanagaster necrorhizus MCA 3950]